MICDLVGCDMIKMSNVMNQIVNEIKGSQREERTDNIRRAANPVCIILNKIKLK